MIKGSLFNEIGQNLQKGLDWLRKTDLENLADGKYLIDGERIFANVQSYETKITAPFEAHKKYIDIQYMIKGEEKIGVVDYDVCTTVEQYNSQKDIEFLDCSENVNYCTLKEGEFLILYPDDAHQPSLAIDNPAFVKKAVVKVLI